ncbi:hypothetical protein K438DRAFT_1929344 [Mycena galopus ATCC 62051]|nr:hypothetical protein K438DRAFT_1929344 [Mycena galopus ATCC 62051]
MPDLRKDCFIPLPTASKGLEQRPGGLGLCCACWLIPGIKKGIPGKSHSEPGWNEVQQPQSKGTEIDGFRLGSEMHSRRLEGLIVLALKSVVGKCKLQIVIKLTMVEREFGAVRSVDVEMLEDAGLEPLEKGQDFHTRKGKRKLQRQRPQWFSIKQQAEKIFRSSNARRQTSRGDGERSTRLWAT